eukprot:8824007-Lingulodinium_polyedra.AAC.1
MSTDSNLNEKRGDFLVSRADAVDIRLHPQQATKKHTTGMKEALPVWGSLGQWSPRPPALHQHEALQRRPAASQGQR